MLSIGDGANDVAMITESDVGVGIEGHEGKQAARASDYSFGEFKMLIPLLFIHGRECYRRNADLIFWTFYKNMLYTTANFWFGMFSFFSGQMIYEAYVYQAFNILNTGVSIIFYALFDYEYSKQDLKAKPDLYKIGPSNIKFTNTKFVKWLLSGWFQAFVVFMLCFYPVETYKGGGQSSNGVESYNLMAGGQNVYVGCVIVVNMKIIQMSNNLTGWNELLVFGQILMFYT
jgi:phospholipid-transporting ATPase